MGIQTALQGSYGLESKANLLYFYEARILITRILNDGGRVNTRNTGCVAGYIALALLICAAFPAATFGEVADSAAGGFTVKVVTGIHACSK